MSKTLVSAPGKTRARSTPTRPGELTTGTGFPCSSRIRPPSASFLNTTLFDASRTTGSYPTNTRCRYAENCIANRVWNRIVLIASCAAINGTIPGVGRPSASTSLSNGTNGTSPNGCVPPSTSVQLPDRVRPPRSNRAHVVRSYTMPTDRSGGSTVERGNTNPAPVRSSIVNVFTAQNGENGSSG